MGTDGIGTLGLTPIRLSRAMEFSTIRSAGASTPRALCSELHSSGSAMATAAAAIIISDQATTPATHLAVVLPDSLDTLIAFVEVVSAAQVEAASVAVDSAVVGVVVSERAVAEVFMVAAVAASMEGAEDTSEEAEDTAAKVIDKSGRYVDGLMASEFSGLDNGVRQTITLDHFDGRQATIRNTPEVFPGRPHL